MTNQSFSFIPEVTQTIHRPKARRLDGREIIVVSSTTPPPVAPTSATVLLSSRCLFPRSLTARERATHSSNTQIQPSTSPTEQFDRTEVLALLDQLETPLSSAEFATMLNQLTLTTTPQVQADHQENSLDESITDEEVGEEYDPASIYANLFDQVPSSENYYSTLTMTIEDPSQISVYTMTIGTVQLTSSRVVPYSILNGHRPVLETSSKTNFKRIRSKRSSHACQVTAVDAHTAHVERLRENDIILKVRISAR